MMKKDELFLKKIKSRLFYLFRKGYCTNLDTVISETGLDLRGSYNTVDTFVEDYCNKEGLCFVTIADYFRLCKIGEFYIQVDEPIADLMLNLNSNGYTTRFCCCGHITKYGSVTGLYISFKKCDNTVNLMLNVIKELTGASFDSIAGLDQLSYEIKLEARNDYRDKFRFITLEGKRFSGDDIITFRARYLRDRRDEAIKLINNIFITSLSKTTQILINE